MTHTSSTNPELAIVLPLGVVANQLMKIEADLRYLNMKALVYAKERQERALTGEIAARLEKITEALDMLRDLVSDIDADLRPRATGTVRALSRDLIAGKPQPERDD
jgi:chromosome segregation ATPase